MSTGDPFIYNLSDVHAEEAQRRLNVMQERMFQVCQKPMIDAITRLHEYQYTPQITIPADVFYNWQYRQSNTNLLLLLEDV